jgi:hypothetical protein
VLLENAKYTSHYVQKKILSICAPKVKKSIREEIRNNKIFCSLPPILKSWLRPCIYVFFREHTNVLLLHDGLPKFELCHLVISAYIPNYIVNYY